MLLAFALYSGLFAHMEQRVPADLNSRRPKLLALIAPTLNTKHLVELTQLGPKGKTIILLFNAFTLNILHHGAATREAPHFRKVLSPISIRHTPIQSSNVTLSSAANSGTLSSST